MLNIENRRDSMLNDGDFREIDITSYVIEGIRNGSLIFEEVKKFQRIVARPGQAGEQVQTILADGTVETDTRTVELDEKTGEPGWVASNVNGPERWIITDSTFKKKYELDSENPKLFKPKGGPMLAAKLDENVRFAPPMWGGDIINVTQGGYLLMDPTDPKDIYGIGGSEFEGTYALAEGEVYSEISPTWTRDELEFLAAGRDPKTPLSQEDYLRISACIGYRTSEKNNAKVA